MDPVPKCNHSGKKGQGAGGDKMHSIFYINKTQAFSKVTSFSALYHQIYLSELQDSSFPQL